MIGKPTATYKNWTLFKDLDGKLFKAVHEKSTVYGKSVETLHAKIDKVLESTLSPTYEKGSKKNILRNGKKGVTLNKVTGEPRSFTSTKHRRVIMEMSEWLQEAPKIQSMLNSGMSYEAIGKHYGGLSRQRIEQVIRKISAITGNKIKASFKHDISVTPKRRSR